MRFCAALFVPILLVAQDPKPASPPAEIDRALRERASAFLQYQVEGNFRKAFELVAEDSKDFYFALAKTKIQSFKIEEIVYSDNFSKATVRAATSRKTVLAGNEIEVPSLGADIWKREGDQWVWFHDPQQDAAVPFFAGMAAGGVAPAPGSVDPKFLPKDTSPEAVAKAGANLIQPTSFNKSGAKFVTGKAGSEEVLFHNGNRGQVLVFARVRGNPPGIVVEPAETYVNALADITFKVSYAPGDSTPQDNMVLFEVQPFRTVYTFPVTVSSAAPQSK